MNTEEMSIDEMHLAYMRIWSEVVKRGINSVAEKRALVKELGYSFTFSGPACHFIDITGGMEQKDIIRLCEAKCPIEWGTFGSFSDPVPCERRGSPYLEWRDTDRKSVV